MSTNQLPTASEINTNMVLVHHVGSDKHKPLLLECDGVPYVFHPQGKRWVQRWVRKPAPEMPNGHILVQEWFRPDPKKHPKESDAPVTAEEASLEVPIKALLWWTTGKNRDLLYEPMDDDDQANGGQRKLRLLTDQQLRNLRKQEGASMDEELEEKRRRLAGLDAELEAKERRLATK